MQGLRTPVARISACCPSIYGTPSKEQFGATPSVNYVGRAQHDHIARVLAHYRATINFDPCWQDSVHDRM